jgi:hypothetical protein
MLNITGPEKVTERVRQLQEEGNVQLALHLVDFIIRGAEDQAQRRKAMLLKADLLDIRAGEVRNFIAGNIMRTSAGVLREEAD